ncbi:hypothetical protein CPB86DRAFT_796713 [Serendipita vermifera]|nr:hypothetical protein CPB86DRAFT_796713 [Serendipita vermifera]
MYSTVQNLREEIKREIADQESGVSASAESEDSAESAEEIAQAEAQFAAHVALKWHKMGDGAKLVAPVGLVGEGRGLAGTSSRWGPLDAAKPTQGHLYQTIDNNGKFFDINKFCARKARVRAKDVDRRASKVWLDQETQDLLGGKKRFDREVQSKERWGRVGRIKNEAGEGRSKILSHDSS